MDENPKGKNIISIPTFKVDLIIKLVKFYLVTTESVNSLFHAVCCCMKLCVEFNSYQPRGSYHLRWQSVRELSKGLKLSPKGRSKVTSRGQ